MEGRQPNRLGESLTARQKRVFAVVAAVLVVLFGAVGAWAATSPGSYGRSANGCINVTVPSTTGGGILHKCGAAAQTTCAQAAKGHDQTSRLIQHECRQAGLLPATAPSS